MYKYDDETQKIIDGYQKLILDRIEWLSIYYRRMIKNGSIPETAQNLNKMQKDLLNDPELVHLKKMRADAMSMGTNIIMTVTKEQFKGFNQPSFKIITTTY